MASSDASSNNNADFQISEVFNVKNKVALVTGGGSGIGLMCVQALAVNGAKVYIVGRTEEKLQRVADTYGKDIAGQIIPIQADISKKEDITRLVKEIEGKEKCLCVLINNAGISGATQKAEGSNAEEVKKNLYDPENATFDDWTDTYRTNVAQIYFLTTAFLPMLSAACQHQKGFSGCVLNITSISGLVRKSQSHFSYNSSKAAAIHLTTMLAAEIADAGLKIRVNSIAPGVFPSEMTASDSKENQKSELPKESMKEIPAGRPGNDRDMANAILFAVTNQYLNGQTVPVDGGFLIQTGR